MRKSCLTSSLRGAARWCHNPMVEPYVSVGSLLQSLRRTEEPRFFHLPTVSFLFAADRSG